jgi:hypothetical protein
MRSEPALLRLGSQTALEELVAGARREVAEVRRLLERPTSAAVAQSAVHLEGAVNGLRDLERCLRQEGAGRHAGLARELNQLRREVGRASQLLESAAALYMGWARLLFAASGGYTAQGEPAAPVTPRSLSVEA